MRARNNPFLAVAFVTFVSLAFVRASGLPLPMTTKPAAEARRGLTPEEQSLFDSCASGDVDKVRAAIEHGINIECRTPDVGTTPLMQAAVTNERAIVALLIEHGADPNVANDNGFTALHAAAMAGACNSEVALVQGGANLNVRAKMMNNATPLQLAVIQRRPKFAYFLLDDGADPNVRNDEGATALHLAVKSKFYEMIRLLLPYTDRNIRNMNGRTALDLAVAAKDQKSIELLSEEPTTQPILKP